MARVGFPGASMQIETLDRESHKRGCHNAHVRAHAWGVKNNCSTLLVVEDDVVFKNNMDRDWRALAEFLRTAAEKNVKWDAFFLGYTAVRVDDTVIPGIARIQKPMLLHAALFPIETSRRIVAMPPWKPQPKELSILEAYDVHLWYAGLASKTATYGIYPSAAGQRHSQKISFSQDKNPFQNWAKSISGLLWMDRFAHGKCTKIWSAGGEAGIILWKLSLIESVDDWMAAAKVFGCADILNLSIDGAAPENSVDLQPG